MIICFAGTPGSCKTLEAVKRICDDLRRGKRVYTNIDGMGDDDCREAIMALTGLTVYELHERLIHCSATQLLRYWENCKPNSVIYFDEIHKHLNCRDWDKQSNKDFNNSASTHRHDGFNIIFITQDIEKVDRQTRGLVEWTYFFRKNNFFGSLVKSKYFRYTYAGDQHDGKPMKTTQLTMRPEYYRCYRSYSANAKGEVDFETHVNILKHPIMFAIPLVLGFTVWQFLHSGFRHGDIMPSVPKQAAAQVPAKSSAPPLLGMAAPVVPSPALPVPPAARPMDNYSAVRQVAALHVIGVVTGNGKNVVLLSDGRMQHVDKPYRVGDLWH
jgi:zona occludens toxin (predicted ATPase)